MTTRAGRPTAPRMPVREVCREAWRDTVSGAGRAASGALVTAVMVGAVVGLSSASFAQEVRAASSYMASGAATTVQQAEGRIDGRACDALAVSEGVVAAGALRRVERGLVPASTPDSVVPLYEVTAGFPRVIGAEGRSSSTGVIVSAEFAETFDVSADDDVEVRDVGPVPVSGTYSYPDDGRDPDLEYAALAPVPDDGHAFDACWMMVWPERDETVPMLRRVVLPGTGGEDTVRPTVGQLNPRLGAAFTDSTSTVGSKLWPGLAAAALGLSIGAAWAGRRRLALASDLHIGVPRSALLLGIGLQHLMWSVVGAIVAVSVAVVIVRGLPGPDAAPIVLSGVATAALGVVGVVVGGIGAVALVRERALHRYFRSR